MSVELSDRVSKLEQSNEFIIKKLDRLENTNVTLERLTVLVEHQSVMNEKQNETLEKINDNLTNLNANMNDVQSRVGKLEKAQEDNTISVTGWIKHAIWGVPALIVTIIIGFIAMKLGLK